MFRKEEGKIYHTPNPINRRTNSWTELKLFSKGGEVVQLTKVSNTDLDKVRGVRWNFCKHTGYARNSSVIGCRLHSFLLGKNERDADRPHK